MSGKIIMMKNAGRLEGFVRIVFIASIVSLFASTVFSIFLQREDKFYLYIVSSIASVAAFVTFLILFVSKKRRGTKLREMEVKAKTVGIIGGMGPEATLDLFYKIIKATPAKKDQDHIHIIIDNFPQIPDRTAFLLEKGENPLPYILKSVKTLEKANVDVLCMPCNTAHYFVEDIRNASPLPFISIIESTLNEIKNSFEDSKNIGLLATDGTIIGRVYHNIFEVEGYKIITPSEEKQNEVMKIIYSIKTGKIEENIQTFEEIIEHMKFLGSELVILGCTELPILLKYFKPSIPVIDATSCLAKEIVDFAIERK